MIILAVDYGDVRTGLAVCDKNEILASPVCVITERKAEILSEKIAALCAERKAERIVMGLPKNMDGSEGFKVEEVRQFAADLTAERQIPIVWVDERLTTVSAERALLEADVSRKNRKKVVDKMAAVIILQSYLDRF